MIFTEYLMFRAPVFLDEYLHFFPGFRGISCVTCIKLDIMGNAEIMTGVQQIMIGSKCSSYENALAALKAVKASGYDGIELNEFMVKPTPALVRLLTKFAGMPTGNSGKLDWHRLIKESGLKVISLHSYLNSIEEDVSAVADEAKSFGTGTVVIT